jgi:hypothetical protein
MRKFIEVNLLVFRFISIGAVAVMISACSVSFPQVIALQSQLSPKGEESLTVPRKAIWLVSFRGKGHLLAAYQREGFVLFANADTNLEMTFDGWNIVSVKDPLGESQNDLAVTIGEDNQRLYVSDRQAVKRACSSWIWYPSIELGGVWKQECEMGGHNTIALNRNGEIVAMDQQVGPDGERVILERYEQE